LFDSYIHKMAHIIRNDIPIYYDSVMRYYVKDPDGKVREFMDPDALKLFLFHNKNYDTYSYRKSIPNASKTILTGPQSWGFMLGNNPIPKSWRKSSLTCYKCGCQGHYATWCTW
jgi:hypothetical protein